MPARPVALGLALLFLVVLLPRFDTTGALAQDVTDRELERVSAGRTVSIGAVSSGGGVTAIPLELYVARVLAGEGEPNAPDAARQALAVAIRTFALANAGRHRRDGFDLCDTTHCQVLRAPTAATRQAVLATAGRVLTYDGNLAEVFYSASCGGRTESAANVWSAASFPYLRSVVDDVHDDDAAWVFEVSLRTVQQALRRAGFAGARLSNVRVLSRSESGRVARLELAGMKPELMAGEPFRAAVGPRELKSTAFTVERQGETLRFVGRGYGHGIGLCVIGAGRRARRGEGLEAILAQYYPGLELTRLGEWSDERSTESARMPRTRGNAAARTTPGRVPSPVMVVPPAPAVGRAAAPLTANVAEVERLGLQAYHALSTALAVTSEPITIEVHESVESFRRATGQPWWVSAATNGMTIDVAPVSVLTQRDGLESTLRIAIAQSLMTAPLATRPAWVRLGGARYFGRRTPLALPTPKRCPVDAELTLAISAAAQRDAESRAEACFARAYEKVGDWRAVK